MMLQRAFAAVVAHEPLPPELNLARMRATGGG